MMKMMLRKMAGSHDRMDTDTMDMDDMDMFSKMFKNMKSNKYDFPSNDYSPMMKRFMVKDILSFLVQYHY